MTHDGSDGSQYDIPTPAWDADAMFWRLETALADLDAALPEEREQHQAIVEGIRYDLRTLHGIEV